MNDFPLINDKHLYQLFGSTIVQRGLEYVRQSRVKHCEILPSDEGWRVSADVQGSESQPYVVELDYVRLKKGFWDIDGDCNCPSGFACKHQAAVVLYANQLAKREQFSPTPNDGARELQRWLSDWQQQQRLAQEQGKRATSDDGELHFVLEQTQRITVQLVYCQRKRNGDLSKGRKVSFPYNFSSWSRPNWLADDDIPLLTQLQHLCGDYSEMLHGRDGARALALLIATDRCHFGEIGNPVLQMRETIRVQPQWQADNRERYRLQLLPPEFELIKLAPPFALSADRRGVHPVQIDCDPVFAEALCSLPAVAGNALIELSDVLQMQAPKLPLPPTLAKTRDDVPLTAIIRFGNATLNKNQVHYLAPNNTLFFAELLFDYAGSRIACDSKEALVNVTINNKTESLRRNRPREKQLLDRLPQFERLQTILPYGMRPLVPATAMSPTSYFLWLVLLSTHLPAMQREGWQIENRDALTINLSEASVFDAHLEPSSKNDWFDLQLDFDAGGQRINILPVLQAHANAIEKEIAKVIVLRDPDKPDHFIQISTEQARRILTTLSELFNDDLRSGQLRLPTAAALRLNELPVREWTGGQSLREWSERLRAGIQTTHAEPPASFQAQLRPYQQQGLNWLQSLREYQLNGLLADDMGLGKTVQTLAHIAIEKQQDRLKTPVLIICPTSLIANWKHEANRFAPELKLLVHHGAERAVTKKAFTQVDLVISSYPIVQRDIDFIKKVTWHLLVLDEAQTIKNNKSLAAQSVRSVNATHRLALTGTPMENHLGELWSLMDFLMPSLLGNEKQFRRLFRKPIEDEGNDERRQLLVRRIAPLMLRRTKQEVATELPEKQEIVRTLSFDSKQRDLYESVRLAMHERVQQEIAKKGFSRSHIIMLDALLKLRQVCCDPQLVKLPSAKTVKQSAKMDFLFELLPELLSEGRRILLFSQFTEMLDLIEARVGKEAIDYVRLDGQTRDRETPVKRFQNREVPLFLISLKAGGVGLNLTAADTVIHYDPWWNPAVESQATDRAHRIGQDKTVFVYKLISAGTVEEKIHALQQRKQALADGIYRDESNAELSFTADDMAYLLQPLDQES